MEVENRSNRVFHYTLVPNLRDILREGAIPSAHTVDAPSPKDAVWCSTNNRWENSVNLYEVWNAGIRLLNRQETHSIYGLARIEVIPEAAPFTWDEYKRISCAPARAAHAFVREAHKKSSNSDEWRISFEPIPREKWLSIEVWNGIEWITFDEATANSASHPEPITVTASGGTSNVVPMPISRRIEVEIKVNDHGDLLHDLFETLGLPEEEIGYSLHQHGERRGQYVIPFKTLPAAEQFLNIIADHSSGEDDPTIARMRSEDVYSHERWTVEAEIHVVVGQCEDDCETLHATIAGNYIVAFPESDFQPVADRLREHIEECRISPDRPTA